MTRHQPIRIRTHDSTIATKLWRKSLAVWPAKLDRCAHLNGDRVERRLAAILVADVVGYSRLIGADEEGTLAALKTIRRETTAYATPLILCPAARADAICHRRRLLRQ